MVAERSGLGERKWLTLRNSAKAVGISRSKLYELIADGALHTIRIGGRSVILASDLNAFVQQCAKASMRCAA
jgi:excisionase family DNA binding protein